jgi:hypothetical protein
MLVDESFHCIKKLLQSNESCIKQLIRKTSFGMYSRKMHIMSRSCMQQRIGDKMSE